MENFSELSVQYLNGLSEIESAPLFEGSSAGISPSPGTLENVNFLPSPVEYTGNEGVDDFTPTFTESRGQEEGSNKSNQSQNSLNQLS